MVENYLSKKYLHREIGSIQSRSYNTLNKAVLRPDSLGDPQVIILVTLLTQNVAEFGHVIVRISSPLYLH